MDGATDLPLLGNEQRVQTPVKRMCCMSCCSPCVVANYEHITTPQQYKEILKFRSILTTKFDPECKEHCHTLKRLWIICNGGSAPFPGLSSEKWKLLGFQNNSPASDIRGAGLIGISLLLEAIRLNDNLKQAVLRSDDEYPFCAAALSAFYMCVLMLQLHPADTRPGFCPAIGTKIRDTSLFSNSELDAFLSLADKDEVPLISDATVQLIPEENQDICRKYLPALLAIYSYTLKTMDSEWFEFADTYKNHSKMILQFQGILQGARKHTLKALRSSSTSTDLLEQLDV